MLVDQILWMRTAAFLTTFWLGFVCAAAGYAEECDTIKVEADKMRRSAAQESREAVKSDLHAPIAAAMLKAVAKLDEEYKQCVVRSLGSGGDTSNSGAVSAQEFPSGRTGKSSKPLTADQWKKRFEQSLRASRTELTAESSPIEMAKSQACRWLSPPAMTVRIPPVTGSPMDQWSAWSPVRSSQGTLVEGVEIACWQRPITQASMRLNAISFMWIIRNTTARPVSVTYQPRFTQPSGCEFGGAIPPTKTLVLHPGKTVRGGQHHCAVLDSVVILSAETSASSPRARP